MLASKVFTIFAILHRYAPLTARETSGRRDRLGRVRADGVAPGDDFRSRASAAATRQLLQRLSDAIDAQAWRDVRHRRARNVYHNNMLAPLGLFSRQVRRGRVHLLRAGTTLRGLRLERRRDEIRVPVLRL